MASSKRFDNVPRIISNLRSEWIVDKDLQVGKYSCHCDQYIQDLPTATLDYTVTQTNIEPLTQDCNVQLTVPAGTTTTASPLKSGDVKVIANVGSEPFVVTVSTDGNEFQPIDIPAGHLCEFRYVRDHWTVESQPAESIQWNGTLTMTGGAAWQSVPLRGTTAATFTPGANRAIVLRGTISGIDSTGLIYGQYSFDTGAITNAAGAVTITGGGAATVIAENPATFDARLTTNGTDIDLQVTDAGAGGQAMVWVARADIVGI